MFLSLLGLYGCKTHAIWKWRNFNDLDDRVMTFRTYPAIFSRQRLPGLCQIVAGALLFATLAPHAVAAGFAPHTAHYGMKLLSARSSSNIESVTGDMLVRWEGDCDGWTMHNRTVFDVGYTGGETVRITMDATTWESIAGDRYTFLVRTLFNDKESQRIEGTARLDAEARAADFVSPARKRIVLPPDTIFPTRHTEQVLAAADDKPGFVRATVFDGFTDGGAQFVNAIVGGKGTADKRTTSAFPALRAQPVWNVNLAFFPVDKQESAPESEISVRIFGNGIADRMDMDFGDFRVRGELKNLKAAPQPVCE